MNGLDRASSRVPLSRTPAGLLKRLGRAVLWMLVLVLLLRGLSGILSPSSPATAPSTVRSAAPAWPNDEARAFAADFARAYLSFTPRDPEAHASAVRSFVAADLASAIVPETDERAPRQSVSAVTVARTMKLDDRTALVTVAASVSGKGTATRYLAVPVARDRRGGLVVSDLPSFVAPPARAPLSAPTVEPLVGVERGAIEDVLTRFFGAYLAGDARELDYLVPAGVRTVALSQRHELLDVTSLAYAEAPSGRTREVLATVRARDEATRAVYTLRYRLRLVRSDRWYVVAVNTTTHKGG